jgi:hypothetical protein
VAADSVPNPKDIAPKLRQEFRELPENWIILLETKAEESLRVGIESIKILTQKGLSAIIISTSRPHPNLIQLYEESKIDINKVFILCSACKSEWRAAKGTSNVVHTGGVSALTEILIALNKAIAKLKGGNAFFFLDSLSTMLIYNDSKTLAKFIHSLLVKARFNNISGILLSIEGDTNKEIRAEIAQLCDKVIRI